MPIHPKSEFLPHYNPYSVAGQKITNVLCSDGKYRMFTSSTDSDTFFTTPGFVRVNGKSVSGFVWHDSLPFDEENIDGVWKFTASSNRKNTAMLPPWKKECTWCHKDIQLGTEVPLFIGSWQYKHSWCSLEDMFDNITYLEPTCDICGRGEHDSPNVMPYEGDWNGETGNHRYCESNVHS